MSRELPTAAGSQDSQVFHVLSPDECPRSRPAGAAALLLFSTSADHFRRSLRNASAVSQSFVIRVTFCSSHKHVIRVCCSHRSIEVCFNMWLKQRQSDCRCSGLKFGLCRTPGASELYCVILHFFIIHITYLCLGECFVLCTDGGRVHIVACQCVCVACKKCW